MSAVIFDFSDFVLEFPEFAGVEETLATKMFTKATRYLDNSDNSPICNLDIRQEALYLLVAHFLELQKRGGGTVGTLTNATEGSVSAGFSLQNSTVPAPWNQTQYGCDYWALIYPLLPSPLYVE